MPRRRPSPPPLPLLLLLLLTHGTIFAADASSTTSCDEQEQDQSTVRRVVIEPAFAPVLVIDNLLNATAASAAQALIKGSEDGWQQYSWFPGWRQPLPDAYTAMIVEALERLHSTGKLSSAARPPPPRPSSMFTVTCTPPEALPMLSRAPHHDIEGTTALVHYLSQSWRGAPNGGTGFYRERRSGHSRFNEEDCKQAHTDAAAAIEAARAADEGDSTALEKLGNVSIFCVGSLSASCLRLIQLTSEPIAAVRRLRESRAVDELRWMVASTHAPLPPNADGASARAYCAAHARGLDSLMRRHDGNSRRGPRDGVEVVEEEESTMSKPKYMSASDERFELLHAVEYKFNRAVLYDGAMLHSAHIDLDAVSGGANALGCDVTTGRLTASVFLDAMEL